MQKVSIKFIKSFSPYKEGEICAKPENEAEQFVNFGVAEYVGKKSMDAPAVDKKVRRPRIKK